jgi:hypothetical protein
MPDMGLGGWQWGPARIGCPATDRNRQPQTRAGVRPAFSDRLLELDYRIPGARSAGKEAGSTVVLTEACTAGTFQ